MPHLNKVVSMNFVSTAISCIPDTPQDNLFSNPTVGLCTVPCVPTLGVADIRASAQLSMYPNPASGEVHITSSDAIQQVSLYDMTGRLLTVAYADERLSLDMDVRYLHTGIYIVLAKTIAGTATGKLQVVAQ
jgi:hypothetical protein